jgi:F0F1-type ATP synthase membrane subunit a
MENWVGFFVIVAAIAIIMQAVILAGMFLAPLPMMFLAVFTSFVQAFIFALLSMMYIAGSMEEGH